MEDAVDNATLDAAVGCRASPEAHVAMCGKICRRSAVNLSTLLADHCHTSPKCFIGDDCVRASVIAAIRSHAIDLAGKGALGLPATAWRDLRAGWRYDRDGESSEHTEVGSNGGSVHRECLSTDV